MTTERNTATFGKRKHTTEPTVVIELLVVGMDHVQY